MDRDFCSPTAPGRAIGERLDAKQDVTVTQAKQKKSKSAMSLFCEQKQKSPGATATATVAERKLEAAKSPGHATLGPVTGATFCWDLGSGSEEVLHTFSGAAG